MVRSIVAAVVVVCLGGLAQSAAAQTTAVSNQSGISESFAAITFGDHSSRDVWHASSWDAEPQIPVGALNTLYVATAILQVMDFHSTRRALRAGGMEANPVMAGITGNPLLFAATKGAVVASTIMLSHQIAKKNRLAAVLTLTAINSAYAMVVRQNYQIGGTR